MSTIQRIAKQAFITFKAKESPTFSVNLEKLTALVNGIKNSDINLEQPTKDSHKNSTVFGAPVSYIKILESKYFTVGVFILKNGVSIPLHDHPGMHGICKVLYGSVRVKSYDPVPSTNGIQNDICLPKDSFGRIPMRCHYGGDAIFDSESEPCMLSPTNGNFHSIHSHNGQAAFLDILAPPYVTGERDCSYYRECTVTETSQPLSKESESIRWLLEIPPPDDFYCDSRPYRGPDIDLEE